MIIIMKKKMMISSRWLTCETLWTFADEGVVDIEAGAAIFTRDLVAGVAHLTHDPRPLGVARAREAVDIIVASTVV